MGRAWPRFLPGASAETIAHALIIEANAIVVEQLGEGQADLIVAHDRAEAYARAHYSPEDIRSAWNACATAPENDNILLHHLVRFYETAEPAPESYGQRRRGSALVAAKRLRSELSEARPMTAMEREIEPIRGPAAALSF
jgi:hypothetical protein